MDPEEEGADGGGDIQEGVWPSAKRLRLIRSLPTARLELRWRHTRILGKLGDLGTLNVVISTEISTWSQATVWSKFYSRYSYVFSEQGATRGCGGHGGADLAGAQGTQVHEQDELDEWDREGRGLKICPAPSMKSGGVAKLTEESLQSCDQNSRRNNVVLFRVKWRWFNSRYGLNTHSSHV